MTAIDLRTEIMRLLHGEENTSVLEAMRMLLRREEADVDEDITDEELAELERRREERLRGDVPLHSVEESIRLARKGFKG